MNRASWISIIIILMIYGVAVFLSLDLMEFVKNANNPKMTIILGFVIFILPILTVSIYAISVQGFWEKLTQDRNTAKYTRNMVNLLVRHQKDGESVEIIFGRLTNENVLHHTIHERRFVIDRLISKDKKRNLWRCIYDLGNICNDAEIDDFKKEVSRLLKENPLNQTSSDDRFVDLINNRAVTVMSYVGGTTWNNILNALKPIFEGVNKDQVEDFLIKVDGGCWYFNQFDASFAKRAEYLQVEKGYRNLILNLRKWLINREDTQGKP